MISVDALVMGRVGDEGGGGRRDGAGEGRGSFFGGGREVMGWKKGVCVVGRKGGAMWTLTKTQNRLL